MKELGFPMYDYMSTINCRHKFLHGNGFGDELYKIFEKNLNEKNDAYGEIIRTLFWNRQYKRPVSHFYDTNAWLHGINLRLYDTFRSYSEAEQSKLFEEVKIDHRLIVCQANSLIRRPIGLERPSSTADGCNDMPPQATNSGFMRIGYYEKELSREEIPKTEIKEITSYGGVIFGKKRSSVPYSKFRLRSNGIYDSNKEELDKEDNIVAPFIQTADMFENYKILWLSGGLVKELGLDVCHFSKGLYASNKSGDVVLKYGQWNTDYYGEHSDDEIPRLSGSELLIRNDYYLEICKIFGDPLFCIFTKTA